MATIIYPLCESNLYVVAPDSSTSMQVDNLWLFPSILFANSFVRTGLPSSVSACFRSFVRYVTLRRLGSFFCLVTPSLVRSFSRSDGGLVVPSVDRSFLVRSLFVRSLRSFAPSVDCSLFVSSVYWLSIWLVYRILGTPANYNEPEWIFLFRFLDCLHWWKNLLHAFLACLCSTSYQNSRYQLLWVNITIH